MDRQKRIRKIIILTLIIIAITSSIVYILYRYVGDELSDMAYDVINVNKSNVYGHFSDVHKISNISIQMLVRQNDLTKEEKEKNIRDIEEICSNDYFDMPITKRRYNPDYSYESKFKYYASGLLYLLKKEELTKKRFGLYK